MNLKNEKQLIVILLKPSVKGLFELKTTSGKKHTEKEDRIFPSEMRRHLEVLKELKESCQPDILYSVKIFKMQVK